MNIATTALIALIALSLAACNSDRRRITFEDATVLPTLIPTVPPTTPVATPVPPAAAIDGVWKNANGWSMQTRTQADGTVLSYADRTVTGSVTARQWMSMESYGTSFEGNTYVYYSTGCTDELYTIWVQNGVLLHVSLMCTSCQCGFIRREFAATFPMTR